MSDIEAVEWVWVSDPYNFWTFDDGTDRDVWLSAEEVAALPSVAMLEADNNRLARHLNAHHTALSALRRVHGLEDMYGWPKIAEEAYIDLEEEES